MKVDPKDKLLSIFFKNFIGGIGQAIGATVGFAFFVALLGFILKRLGGLPFIGNLFASLIEVTSKALEAKKIISQ